MKFLLQLPCCSCFCFIKKKKGKSKEKEPKEHWKSCFYRTLRMGKIEHRIYGAPSFAFPTRYIAQGWAINHHDCNVQNVILMEKSSCNDISDFKSFNSSSCLYLHLWVLSLFPPFDVQRKQTQSLLETYRTNKNYALNSTIVMWLKNIIVVHRIKWNLNWVTMQRAGCYVE